MPDFIPPPSIEIVVTASRAEEARSDTPASVTLIDEDTIERTGEPLVTSLLRLVPSLSVSASGTAGSVTEVRIRGAEAVHTLLFVDGIRANDPAAGNIPRFELLNSDTVSRIEVVRGPQSALWGSEAIGGVVAVDGGGTGTRAGVEAGSFGFRRIGGGTSMKQGGVTADFNAGFQRATGIDAFDGPVAGERDGYRNLSARARIVYQPSSTTEIGASGFLLTGRSEFDGYDPLTFQRADTLDNSRNRLTAARLWGKANLGKVTISGWGSALGSTNRNFLEDRLLNRTRGGRIAGGGQAEIELETAGTRHRLIAAAETTRETFRSRNPSDPFADQEQDREQRALVAEWRADWATWLSTDLALRRDAFNRFKDRSTLRASALLKPAHGLQLIASYGEGIAQPSFFDLFGFYPGLFIGNPDLKPERSRGWEISARLQSGPLRAAVTGYRQRLTEEIVPTADFSSTENADGRSRRQGVEVELGWARSDRLQLTIQYAYLNAEEQKQQGVEPTRELRRPRHGGSVGVDGRLGRLSYGATLAYVGKHRDRRDSLPYDLVDLDAYWLAGARLAWRLDSRWELFGRVANALDSDYQDLAGYRTEGRSAYVGLRLAFRR